MHSSKAHQRHRAILELFQNDQLSPQQIAEQLGYSQRTVYQVLSRLSSEETASIKWPPLEPILGTGDLPKTHLLRVRTQSSAAPEAES